MTEEGQVPKAGINKPAGLVEEETESEFEYIYDEWKEGVKGILDNPNIKKVARTLMSKGRKTPTLAHLTKKYINELKNRDDINFEFTDLPDLPESVVEEIHDTQIKTSLAKFILMNPWFGISSSTKPQDGINKAFKDIWEIYEEEGFTPATHRIGIHLNGDFEFIEIIE